MSLEDHFLSRVDPENRQFLCLQQKDMSQTFASVRGKDKTTHSLCFQ